MRKRGWKRPKVVKQPKKKDEVKVRRELGAIMGNPLFRKRVEAKKKGKGSYNRKRVRNADSFHFAA